MSHRAILWFFFSALLAVAEEPKQNGTVEVAKRPRIALGGITVGAGYSRFSGPYYPYYPYRYYYPAYWGWDPFFSPAFYAPFYHPLYGTGFARGPNMGEIKLEADKRAEVFLDGAYAGFAGDLKSIWLEPGAYNFEVRTGGATSFSRRIYVLSGKRLKIATEDKK